MSLNNLGSELEARVFFFFLRVGRDTTKAQGCQCLECVCVEEDEDVIPDLCPLSGSETFVCEVQFLLPSMGNSQPGLSRDDQRNRTVNRIIERHSFLEDVNNLHPFPSSHPNLTPHFHCSKVDEIWMRTFGTLSFYLLIYPLRDRLGRRDGAVD